MMIEVEEQAKEELRMLEVQYPNSYEYLKLELKSFIVLLQSHHHQYLNRTDHHNMILLSDHHTQFSTAATQESTSNRKRKKKKISENHCDVDIEDDKQEFQNQSLEDIAARHESNNINGRKLGKKRDRVELVLDRAHECLRKIRHLKSALLSSSSAD